MPNTKYKRTCPDCGKDIVYCSLDSFRHSKPGTKCRWCCNVLRGKTSNRKGFHHTEFSKSLISSSQKGKKIDVQTRLRMSAGQKKYCFDPKVRQLKSEIQKKYYSNPEIRLERSNAQKRRYSDPKEVRKMAAAVKKALHIPEIRKRHIEALYKSKWLKVKTDIGQLELLEKWNRLGFHFEPNFQLKTDNDLFYIDGYDTEHKVIIEYDGKYHKSHGQKQKDFIRQQKIVEFLRPKKFWRYDSETKTIKNVLEEA